MKTLVLIAGLPGTGKSTIAKQMVRGLSDKAVHFDIDDFKRDAVECQDTLEDDIDPDHIRWIYYERALKSALETFKKTQFELIVMEEVFHSADLRERIALWCKQEGIALRWILVTCSLKVIEDRLRKTPRTGHILTTEMTLELNQRFREIFAAFMPEEEVIVISNDKDSDTSSML